MKGQAASVVAERSREADRGNYSYMKSEWNTRTHVPRDHLRAEAEKVIKVFDVVIWRKVVDQVCWEM
jgi:hypothetical protein